MSAAHYKLDNITALVDRNGVQIDGTTSSVMGLEPLGEKWTSFGWNVIVCDGHDHEDIINAFREASYAKGKPSVIIAKTTMGKGIVSIEGDHHWHGKAPTKEDAIEFLKELEGNNT
jgi:transketolase